MSSRDYIAWSLLVAGSVAAIGFAVSRIARHFGWAEWLHARQRRKMERRLELARSRAPSRYFEDAGSIQREIEAHDIAALPIERRFQMARAALIVLATIWLGFVLVSRLAHPVLGLDAPELPGDSSWVWMPLLGALHLMQSLEPNAQNRITSRVLGIGLLSIGALAGIKALVALA